MHTGFWWGSLREGDHLEDAGVDVKMDLQKWVGVVDWIDLAQDRDKWRALVKAVMKHRFP